MSEKLIPKVIHYCWFGGNPLPESAIKCIDSWRKHCPDYEIKEWNESNFDINCCDYVREAYDAKKWAFVSDYARFWILYHEGGLYFDTDVEVIRPIDDIVAKGPFMGCEQALTEDSEYGLTVNPGLGLAAPAGMEFYKDVLDAYQKRHFRREDGTLDTMTIVVFTTSLLVQRGFTSALEIQFVEGVFVYPPEYFCPLDYLTKELVITDNTRSIHQYTESWLSSSDRASASISRAFSRYGRPGSVLARALSIPVRVWGKVQELGIKGTIQFIKAKMRKTL